MYLRSQFFTIVAIIYSSYSVLANNSDDCPCDVIEVEGDWLVGTQKFTKQIGTLNGEPYYFSTKWYLISWKTGTPPYWSIDKFNAFSKAFESIQNFTVRKMFSFESMCQPNKWNILNRKTGKNIVTIIKCLNDNSNCSASKELTMSFKDGNHSKQVQLQAKEPCQFPFIYKNVIYNSCIKRGKYLDKFWCATSVDATNRKKRWGQCNDLCPLEDEG